MGNTDATYLAQFEDDEEIEDQYQDKWYGETKEK